VKKFDKIKKKRLTKAGGIIIISLVFKQSTRSHLPANAPRHGK
jgi:hypothetical protein